MWFHVHIDVNYKHVYELTCDIPEYLWMHIIPWRLHVLARPTNHKNTVLTYWS
jgi:hypothetical protein